MCHRAPTVSVDGCIKKAHAGHPAVARVVHAVFLLVLEKPLGGTMNESMMSHSIHWHLHWLIAPSWVSCVTGREWRRNRISEARAARCSERWPVQQCTVPMRMRADRQKKKSSKRKEVAVAGGAAAQRSAHDRRHQQGSPSCARAAACTHTPTNSCPQEIVLAFRPKFLLHV